MFSMCVIHGDMITNSQQTAIASLSFPFIENTEEIIQAVYLDCVKRIEKAPRRRADRAHDGLRAQPPRHVRPDWRRRSRHDVNIFGPLASAPGTQLAKGPL